MYDLISNVRSSSETTFFKRELVNKPLFRALSHPLLCACVMCVLCLQECYEQGFFIMPFVRAFVRDDWPKRQRTHQQRRRKRGRKRSRFEIGKETEEQQNTVMEDAFENTEATKNTAKENTKESDDAAKKVEIAQMPWQSSNPPPPEIRQRFMPSRFNRPMFGPTSRPPGQSFDLANIPLGPVNPTNRPLGPSFDPHFRLHGPPNFGPMPPFNRPLGPMPPFNRHFGPPVALVPPCRPPFDPGPTGPGFRPSIPSPAPHGPMAPAPGASFLSPPPDEPSQFERRHASLEQPEDGLPDKIPDRVREEIVFEDELDERDLSSQSHHERERFERFSPHRRSRDCDHPDRDQGFRSRPRGHDRRSDERHHMEDSPDRRGQGWRRSDDCDKKHGDQRYDESVHRDGITSEVHEAFQQGFPGTSESFRHLRDDRRHSPHRMDEPHHEGPRFRGRSRDRVPDREHGNRKRSLSDIDSDGVGSKRRGISPLRREERDVHFDDAMDLDETNRSFDGGDRHLDYIGERDRHLPIHDPEHQRLHDLIHERPHDFEDHRSHEMGRERSMRDDVALGRDDDERQYRQRRRNIGEGIVESSKFWHRSEQERPHGRLMELHERHLHGRFGEEEKRPHERVLDEREERPYGRLGEVPERPHERFVEGREERPFGRLGEAPERPRERFTERQERRPYDGFPDEHERQPLDRCIDEQEPTISDREIVDYGHRQSLDTDIRWTNNDCIDDRYPNRDGRFDRHSNRLSQDRFQEHDLLGRAHRSSRRDHYEDDSGHDRDRGEERRSWHSRELLPQQPRYDLDDDDVRLSRDRHRHRRPKSPSDEEVVGRRRSPPRDYREMYKAFPSNYPRNETPGWGQNRRDRH